MSRICKRLVVLGLLLAVCGGPYWIEADDCGSPIHIETIMGSGNEISGTLSNESGAPATSYLTLDFEVGGTSYVWSLAIAMAGSASANFTITFDGEPTLFNASSCALPGGTTESPDPVVGVRIGR